MSGLSTFKSLLFSSQLNFYIISTKLTREFWWFNQFTALAFNTEFKRCEAHEILITTKWKRNKRLSMKPIFLSFSPLSLRCLCTSITHTLASPSSLHLLIRENFSLLWLVIVDELAFRSTLSQCCGFCFWLSRERVHSRNDIFAWKFSTQRKETRY